MRYINHARQLPLDRPLYVYGAGGRSRELLAELKDCGHSPNILAFVDSFCTGEFEGYSVLSPEGLAAQDRGEAKVVVSATSKEEIQILLRDLGIPVDYYYRPMRLQQVEFKDYVVATGSVIPWRHVPCGRLPRTTAAGRDHYSPLGYACHDFTPKDLNIAFFGCSWTDDTPARPSYSRVVCECLEKEYGISVGHWNLGLTAHGNDYIARTILCGIDEIKPDIVWVTFSGFDRKEYYTLDGRLIRYQLDWLMAEKDRHPFWKQLSMVEKEAISLLNKLSNPCDDAAAFIKDYKLVEMSLEMRGILWGYSSVSSARNVQLFPEYLASGWLNLERYLGTCFEFYDREASQPAYPGPRSRQIFGEQIFQWLRAHYGPQIEGIVNARRGRAG